MNAPTNNATAGKMHTVSLELAPEQVKKITAAQHLGKLSLALRAAVERQDTADTGTMFSCNVSPEIARRKLPEVQRWWFMQAIRLRNTQSSCRRNSDER